MCDLSESIEPVGYPDVRNGQLRLNFGKEQQTVQTVAGGIHMVFSVLQPTLHNRSKIRIIVTNQNRRIRHLAAGLRRFPPNVFGGILSLNFILIQCRELLLRLDFLMEMKQADSVSRDES